MIPLPHQDKGHLRYCQEFPNDFPPYSFSTLCSQATTGLISVTTVYIFTNFMKMKI